MQSCIVENDSEDLKYSTLFKQKSCGNIYLIKLLADINIKLDIANELYGDLQ